MATQMAKTIASSPRQCCCCALAPPLAGASPLPPGSALSVRSRRWKATRIASAPLTLRSVKGRETRERSQRSRSLHRRRGGGAAAASPSSPSETEKAKTAKKRRSRSRTRLLPSLEDLRPQRGAGSDDEDEYEATVSLSSAAAAASTSASASTSSSTSSRSSSTNSVLAAVALIVGSSVGAGVLALPAVSAPAGFAPSVTALVGVWALLTAEALLIAEVNLALLGAKKRGRRSKRRGRGSESGNKEVEDSSEDEAIVTLREMAHETLGARGGHFVAAAYLALSYSLMVAYISKAGELVSSALDPLVSPSFAVTAPTTASSLSSLSSSVSPGTGAALFTAAMGLTLFGGTAAVDGANKAMTLSLLAAYAVIVAAGGAQAEWGALAERAPDWGAAPAAVPVISLSLVYHDLVPVVCAQLRGDAGKVRTALFVGSAVPLAMFILWDAVALALVGGESGIGETLSSSSSSTFVDPLTTLISSGGGAVGAAVGAFSLLAIVTSCLGTALGLSSTLMAEIKGLVDAAGAKGEEKVKDASAAAAAKAAAMTSSSPSTLASSNPLLHALSTTLSSISDDDSSSEEEDEEKAELAATATAAIRVAAFALVLGPPLADSLANPGSFFGVLNAVGGYGMTALYGVLPPLMAWKFREQQEKGKEEEESEVETAKAKAPEQQQELAPDLASSSPRRPAFSPPLLPGGRAALTALTTASVAVEVGRLADDLEGWRRAASEGAAAASSSSFANSSTAAASAISSAFEGFMAGGDAGEKLSSSVVAHVSELLAAILQ